MNKIVIGVTLLVWTGCVSTTQSSAGRYVTDIDVVGDRLLAHRCEVDYEVTRTTAIIYRDRSEALSTVDCIREPVAVPALYPDDEGTP